ncbi:unnamed protein product [Amaranthus hypochondriacus]
MIIPSLSGKKEVNIQDDVDVMFGKLADLEAQCGILDEKMRKFDVEEDEIKSAMAHLKKEDDDLKMSLLKSWCRKKTTFFFALLLSWAMFVVSFFSNVHIVGEL